MVSNLMRSDIYKQIENRKFSNTKEMSVKGKIEDKKHSR